MTDAPPDAALTTSDDTLPTDSAPATTARLPSVGDLLVGRYRLERELGRGGMAVVFEALDLELDRRVAVKALSAAPADGTAGWSLLLEEARAQAAFDSPNAARLLDALQDGDRRYLVMERVDGPDLKDVISGLRTRLDAEPGRPRPRWLQEALGPAPPGEEDLIDDRSWDVTVAAVVERLSVAVDSMHSRGIVHRDLKPGNVKMTGGAQPVVLDFGLAGRLEDSGPESFRGTPAYLAPEQARRASAGRDPRTDVYQIGLILYELLALRRARDTERIADLSELLEIAQTGRMVALEEAAPGVDRGIAAVCRKALEVEPEARYQDLATLREDLSRVRECRAPLYAETTFGYRVQRGVAGLARRRSVVATAAALTLGLVAWGLRSALEPSIFTMEAWRFRPGEERLATITTGSAVRVDDDLGLRLNATRPAHVYVLSLFGDDEASFVQPVRSIAVVDGEPEQPGDDERWAYRASVGQTDLLCVNIAEANPTEGLIAFAAEGDEPLLDEWFEELEAWTADSFVEPGVPHGDALRLLERVKERLEREARSRGDGWSDRDPGENLVDRYASLDSAQVAGIQPWTLEGVQRFEVRCRVAAE